MDWKPIKDAPKEAKKLLLWFTCFGGVPAIGRWEDDRYSKRPRPFWNSREFQVTDCRNGQPTHYAEITPPEKGLTR